MTKFKYLIILLCALAFFSCKKNQLGGKSNIKGKVMHHSRAIPFAKIYIKYNAKEFPSDIVTNHDAMMTADLNGNFLVDKIYHGDYYFYAVGEDDQIPSPYIVKGGIYLKVKMLKEVTGFEIPITE